MNASMAVLAEISLLVSKEISWETGVRDQLPTKVFKGRFSLAVTGSVVLILHLQSQFGFFFFPDFNGRFDATWKGKEFNTGGIYCLYFRNSKPV